MLCISLTVVVDSGGNAMTAAVVLDGRRQLSSTAEKGELWMTVEVNHSCCSVVVVGRD
jgi:hypothetical protein